MAHGVDARGGAVELEYAGGGGYQRGYRQRSHSNDHRGHQWSGDLLRRTARHAEVHLLLFERVRANRNSADVHFSRVLQHDSHPYGECRIVRHIQSDSFSYYAHVACERCHDSGDLQRGGAGAVSTRGRSYAASAHLTNNQRGDWTPPTLTCAKGSQLAGITRRACGAGNRGRRAPGCNRAEPL